MDLTNTIRSLRESKGLTQEDLADRFGVTRSNYAYLEGRGNKLTIEQLEKIANALDVSVVQLLTGEAQNVKDSEEIEQLKKRNLELEDRIKDKDTIIKNTNDKLDKITVVVHDHLIKEVRFFGLNNKIGTVICINKKTGEEFSILSKDYFESDLIFDFIETEQKTSSNRWMNEEDRATIKRKQKIEKPDIQIKTVKFTPEEKKEVIQLLLEDNRFLVSYIPFILLGFLKDKEIADAIKNKYFPEIPYLT